MCKKIDGTIVYKVGTVSLSLASLVYATASIEQIPSGASFFFKEAIYFIGKNQNKQGGGYESESIKVLMNINELKALSYAMKEYIKMPVVNNTKVSTYEKISNSGTMKKVYLGFTPQREKRNGVIPEMYYINIRLNAQQPKTVSVSCDRYKFLSFADSLYNLANEVEKTMFLYERGKDKKIRDKKD